MFRRSLVAIFNMTPVESMLCFLIVVAFWVYLLIEVAKDAKWRDPDRAVFWCALVLFFGPIGFIVYINARPDKK